MCAYHTGGRRAILASALSLLVEADFVDESFQILNAASDRAKGAGENIYCVPLLECEYSILYS
jgi:hypothetical protein